MQIVDLYLHVITKQKLIEPLHSRCTVVDFRIVNGQELKQQQHLWKDVLKY